MKPDLVKASPQEISQAPAVTDAEPVLLAELVPAQRAFAACSYSLLERDVCLLTGESGTGKTVATSLYCRRNPGSFLFTVTNEITCPRAFLDCLVCRSLGLKARKRGVENLFPMAVDALSKAALLVIDEADRLPPSCLEVLRQVHDASNIGLVLVGRPVLADTLRAPGAEVRPLADRIGGVVTLSALNMIDARLLACALCPSIDQRTIDKLLDCSRANLRSFVKTLKRAMHLAAMSESPIGPEHIRSAAGLMLL